MKKLTLLAAIFILFIPFNSKSQDTLQKNIYPVESSGSRIILDANSRYVKNSGDVETLPFIEQIDIRASCLASMWKYGKKINYLGSLSLNENYTYDEKKDNIYKKNYINSDFYGSADYYLQPGKLYVNGSYSLRMLRSYYYSKHMYEWDSSVIEGCSFTAGHLIWVSAGFGRIINHARTGEINNIENVLLKNKIIQSPLSNTAKQKLVILAEKRNNRDYQAKFKDDDEIKFMAMLKSSCFRKKQSVHP